MEYLNIFLIKMWTLVIDQVSKSRCIIVDRKLNLISEVNSNEKRVDSYELKIDMDVEEYFKRGVENTKEIISILKINYNLERIGDYAYSISNILKRSKNDEIPQHIIDYINISEMFDICIEALKESLEIYKNSDIDKIHDIYGLEEKLNQLHISTTKKIYDYINSNTKDSSFYLNCLIIINKLERLGDHVINIIEEITSYLESRTIKHSYLKDSQLVYATKEKDIIKVEDIILDKSKFIVNRNGKIINLPKKEFQLFHLLLSEVNRVFTREEILSKIWGDNVIVGSKTIDVHIRKIRKKLEIDNIISIKGVGYKYELKN